MEGNYVKSLVLMLVLFLIVNGPSGSVASGEERNTLLHTNFHGLDRKLVGAGEWIKNRRVKPPSPPPPMYRLPTHNSGQVSISSPPPNSRERADLMIFQAVKHQGEEIDSLWQQNCQGLNRKLVEAAEWIPNRRTKPQSQPPAPTANTGTHKTALAPIFPPTSSDA
ncbi:hypothetical protein Pfo_024231 [Paulownia fortunei]|nr:hypothetical protein Pfo_024231 [Paulownia fortunei]